MSAAKHTPGPWVPSPKMSDAIISTAEGLAPSYPNEFRDYGGMVICETVDPRNKPLLLAAPELLERLKKLAHCSHGSAAWHEECERAYSVIAKAEGR